MKKCANNLVLKVLKIFTFLILTSVFFPNWADALDWELESLVAKPSYYVNVIPKTSIAVDSAGHPYTGYEGEKYAYYGIETWHFERALTIMKATEVQQATAAVWP